MAVVTPRIKVTCDVGKVIQVLFVLACTEHVAYQVLAHHFLQHTNTSIAHSDGMNIHLLPVVSE